MKVLAIEDSPTNMKVVSTALCRDEYLVDAAPGGCQGLRKAAARDYDAILCPHFGSGAPFMGPSVQANTDSGRFCALPDRGLRGGTGIGADDYVAKPFALLELKARLRALLRRSRALTDAVVEAGDVKMCGCTKQTMVDGRERTLTRVEHELLEMLLLNRGRVISCRQIYGRLFDAVDPDATKCPIFSESWACR